jgi:hypothetical protein
MIEQYLALWPERAGLEDQVDTASYRSSEKVIHCTMYGGDFQVDVGPCSRLACGSKFIARDEAEFGAGTCFRCG